MFLKSIFVFLFCFGVLSGCCADIKSLFDACVENNLEAVKALVKSGVDVNSKYKHKFALDVANNPEIISFLLKNGANPDLKNEYGMTALLMAIHQEKFEKAKLLIEKGANIKNNASELLGKITFKLYSNERTNLLDFLIKQGFDVNVKDKFGRRTILFDLLAMTSNSKELENTLKWIKYLVEKGLDLNARDDNDNTVLSEAVGRGKLKVVKYLINLGANAKVVDRRGENLLFRVYPDKKNFKLIEFLLEKGLDINHKNNKGLPVIARFISYGDLEIIKFLVENGAKLDYKSDSEHNANAFFSALQSANLNPDLLNYLISKGIDINYKNKMNRTVLFYSLFYLTSEGCNLDRINFLLKKDIDVNVQDEDGNNVLQALFIDVMKISKVFFKIDLVKEGYLPIIKTIIDKGVDLKAKNKKNQTALDLAKEYGDARIIDFIEDKLKKVK